MNEIILGKKKNGMAVLIGTILVILLSIAGIIYGAVTQNDFILTLLALYWNSGRKLIEDFSKSSRSARSDPLRKIYRNSQRRWILLCQPFLRQC